MIAPAARRGRLVLGLCLAVAATAWWARRVTAGRTPSSDTWPAVPHAPTRR